jgi:tetratricopeptide (TPR) repeat protein
MKKMSDFRPNELIHAEELMYNGKLEEVLEIIRNFERISELSPKDKLSTLLLKGNIYQLTHQFKKAVEAGESAYSMSQELGLVHESIEALTLKAWIVRYGKNDDALNLILEAEKLLSSLSEKSLTSIAKAPKQSYGWIFFIFNWLFILS